MTKDPGPRVTAILELFRPVADEIVVAADASAARDAIASYAAVADRLIEFDHDGTERHLAWLHEQCRGEWVFRIDGDEVPSALLLRELPALVDDRRALQQWVPRRWCWPDASRWIDSLPWSPDYQNRLVRNDGTLWFSGELHTAAEPVLPARYLEAPIYHLDCVLTPVEERRRKVRRYAPSHTGEVAGGGGINTYYLPERKGDLRLRDVPPEDAALIARVLRGSKKRKRPPRIETATSSDVSSRWSGRDLAETAYRAELAIVESDLRMPLGEVRPIHVRVRNLGDVRWPGGMDHEPLIRIAYRWLHADETPLTEWTHRSPLPAAVEPGEAAIAPAVVIAPDAPGAYVLELDLVHEFVRWFGCTTRARFDVFDNKRWSFQIGDLVRASQAHPATDGTVPYLGWLGYGNLGDDAMFDVCRAQLGDERLLGLPHSAIRDGIALDGASTIVLGGGTLIGHAEFREALERAPEATLLMFAPGVDDPEFRDTDREVLHAELERWRDVLPRFEAVVVRGPRSQELLAELGVAAAIVGDPALLVGEGVRRSPSADRLLGVNLGIAWKIWGKDPDLLLEHVAEALRTLSAEGWAIRFVPVWRQDMPYTEEAARRASVEAEIVRSSEDLNAVLRAVGECSVFVGQKLHSVVLANALGVPSVALEYHPKCTEYQRSVGMQDFGVRTDELLPSDIVERVRELDANRGRYEQLLAQGVRPLQQQLQRHLERMRDVLGDRLKSV